MDFWTPRRRFWHAVHVAINSAWRRHPRLPLRRLNDWAAGHWVDDWIAWTVAR